MVPPRPLAGLPAVDSGTVARAWLVRRIAAAPLEAAAGLASGAFAARGPDLCGALLAALADDVALTALPAEAEALQKLVNASGSSIGAAAADLAAATEHLRRAALDAVMPATDHELHAALHDRLAHACAQLLWGALAAPAADAAREAPAAPAALAAREASVAPAADAPPAAAGVAAALDPPAARPPITVRDARARADPSGRLTAEAERFVAALRPFALLAVEVEDAGVVPAGVLAAAEAALGTALPAGALHAPDGPGSMLVLAPEADGISLARALTQAVAAAASHRGAPVRAAAGVAEYPRDGDTPDGLLAHADGQLFAARAEGLPLTPSAG